MSPAGTQDPIWFPSGSPEPDIARVTARFTTVNGHPPDGVWSAPGRVNLIGEHVDYNGGHCLPFALSHRTYVAAGRRPDQVITLESAHLPGEGWRGTLGDVGPGAPSGWAAYVAGVAWALAQSGQPVGGFDAVIDSRVPLGAGLSSSAALECAVAVALSDLFAAGTESSSDADSLSGAESDRVRARLAQACIQAENEIAQAPTGGMDQSVALRVRPGHAMLLDCRDFSAEHLPFDLDGAGAEILVIDTRVHHALGDGQYGSRRQECGLACERLGVASLRDLADHRLNAESDPLGPSDESDQSDQSGPDVLAALGTDELGAVLRRRVRHVLTELGRVRRMAAILRAGTGAGASLDLQTMGELLDASHLSMRDDYEVSCAELDLAVASARRAGALGARMVGGGFGGSIIALLRRDDRDRVAAQVATAFAGAGLAPPAFAVARPGGPAARVA